MFLWCTKGKGFKKDVVGKKSQDKGKQVAFRNFGVPKVKLKVAADAKCFYYDLIGHWKQNCSKYLKDKKSRASTSGIFSININLENFTYWVFDTACVSHIVSYGQGLRMSRTLAKGEVELRIGNGARVAALAVETYSLPFPSGLILVINSCYYVHAITKKIFPFLY